MGVTEEELEIMRTQQKAARVACSLSDSAGGNSSRWLGESVNDTSASADENVSHATAQYSDTVNASSTDTQNTRPCISVLTAVGFQEGVPLSPQSESSQDGVLLTPEIRMLEHIFEGDLDLQSSSLCREIYNRMVYSPSMGLTEQVCLGGVFLCAYVCLCLRVRA